MKKLFLLFSMTLLSAESFAQAPTNGLVAYFNFENSLASHNAGHSFNNASSQPLTYTTTGKVGSCANFLGAQALFNTTMLATGDLNTNCTVAWWEFRYVPTPAVGSTSIDIKESLSFSYVGNSNCNGVAYSDRYRLSYSGTTGSANYTGCREVNTHTAGNGGVWVHHALVKEGGKLSYYMNGTLSWTPVGGIDIGTQFINNATSNNFIVGGKTIGPGNLTVDTTKFINGKIDELYVYNRALTGVEVDGIKNNGTTTAVPLITNIGSYSTATNTQIMYNLYGYNLPTTSVINYGTSASALTSQVTGGTTSGLFGTNSSTILPNLTAGTTYYYQIKATNPVGDRFSPVLSFVAGAFSPVIRFRFDNNLSSDNNTYTLTPIGTATPSFVPNRYGEANKAVYLNNNKLHSYIAALPIAREDRTVSFWVKRLSNTQHSIFGWGSTNLGNAYGAFLESNGKFTNYTYGAGYDYYFTSNYSTD